MSVCETNCLGTGPDIDVNREELKAMGFRLGGLVCPDPTPLHFRNGQGYGLFRVEISWPVEGWVTYIHVANNQFKKAGKTEAGKAFKTRMKSSYTCLRRTIEAITEGSLYYSGESLFHKARALNEPPVPYKQDFPWKHRVPLALMEGQVIELWAKPQPNREDMLLEECRLNNRYRGEWAKEGWWIKERKRRVPDLYDESVLDALCRKKLKLGAR